MEFQADSKVRIQIHCPQCRGEIDFLEEAQVIRCEFCGSSLLVAGREGTLRYVVPPRLTDPKEAWALALEEERAAKRPAPGPAGAFLFYAPFWRMQGLVYRWVFGSRPLKDKSPFDMPRPNEEAEIRLPPPVERTKVLLTRMLDHTVPAYGDLEIGLPTLGIRGQALRLQAFERGHLEERDSFLPLEVSREQAQAEARRFSDLFFQEERLSPEATLHRVVGRSDSVLYHPLWRVDCPGSGGKGAFLIDAVAKRVVHRMEDPSVLLSRLGGEGTRKPFKFGQIRFLPFRCPNCGWAFPFRPLSVMHFCPTCRRLFRERGGEWVETEYGVVPPPGKMSAKGILWVPFWRYRTALASAAERVVTMADLYRLAPPPRVVNQERESRRPIYFYVPAVKFRNPRAIHTLGSRLTFLQPDLPLGSFEDGSHPPTLGGGLSAADAQELGMMVLGALIPQANRRVRDWIKNCSADFQDPQVLYFPFSRTDLFWKEMTTGIAFQHNALREEPFLPGGDFDKPRS